MVSPPPPPPPPQNTDRQPMDSKTPLYGEIPEFRRRLIHFTGYGFLLGAGAGSAFHFVRGLRSASSARLVGGVRAVHTNGPRVAGTCGAFVGVHCAFERAMSLARRREDPWNSIASAAAVAGLFRMRRGAAAAAARSALLGATLFVGGIGACWALDLFYISCGEALSNRDPPEPVIFPTRPLVDDSGESNR